MDILEKIKTKTQFIREIDSILFYPAVTLNDITRLIISFE